MAKSRMDKNTVPEDFSLKLALADAVPVIFFGINAVLLGVLFHSILLIMGAALCFIGGAGKVLWKILVAVKKKNIWFLFVQMRVLMPAGFLLMIVSVVFLIRQPGTKEILADFLGLPSVIFFALGILGMVLMSVFAVKLDNSDVKSNRIEELTNGISQIMFFIGILLLF